MDLVGFVLHKQVKRWTFEKHGIQWNVSSNFLLELEHFEIDSLSKS